ncbi:hypothetical protein [Deinococcus aquaticus]|uniref:hypothetical protein n=1 Tax=Deinococcus aquaticus TaxID=328692 RepID=UPI00360A04C4
MVTHDQRPRQGRLGPHHPRKPIQPGRIVMYALLVVAALFFLVPVYLLFATALKSPDAINLATTGTGRPR